MAKRSKGHTLGKLPRAKETDYDVGYGKPPVDTRFKPGRSGNPLGRPKGAKNKANRLPALNEERMKVVVIEEAYRMIGVRDGDRLVEIPVIQAVIRSIALNAAKGDQRSQRMFADLLQRVEREDKASHDEWVSVALDYKIECERELERRKKSGETGADDQGRKGEVGQGPRVQGGARRIPHRDRGEGGEGTEGQRPPGHARASPPDQRQVRQGAR